MIDYYDMAKRNYPDNWNLEMMRRYVQRGKITPEQYEEITGDAYD